MKRLAAALLAGGLLACGGGEPAPRVPLDLLARVAGAEWQPAEAPTGSQALAVEAGDGRDGLAPLRCPAGASVTFRGLRLSGPARVQAAAGSVRHPPPAGSPVDFALEAWPEPAAGDATPAASSRLAVDPARLPATGLPMALDLPPRPDGTWTLRLSVTGPAADWPAFLAPRVLHAGGTLPPLELEELVLDLSAALESAEVLQQSPQQPIERGYFDAAAGVGTAGGRRAVLRTAAPARLRWQVEPPPGAWLRLAAGVDTWNGWKRGGDGLTFAVELDGERVWELALDPHRRARDRGWRALRFDLAAWVGRRVALDLVTEPGPTADFDAGGFSEAAIFRPVAVPRRPDSQGPLVVLILVDTLRADRLGAGLTPRLDALAASGLSFRQARSVSSWTWPATATLLTGLYPAAHGVLDARRCLLQDGLATLPELFAAQGWTTGAFVANHLIDADNGFDQGFETFVCAPNATARALVARALDWVDATPGVARLMYLHLFDPHSPYAAPAPFAPAWPADLPRTLEELRDAPADPGIEARILDALRAQYDGEVAYVDAALGELLDGLAARGALRDALVLVTSDHGEEFREHGLLAHGPHLYEESLAVPLLLAGFGRRALPPGIREAPVSLPDVCPTLLDLAGLPEPPYALPGRLLHAAPAEAPLYAQTLQGLEPGVEGFTEKLAVRDGAWKLIHTPASGRDELYDLAADPRETRDRRAAEPGRAAELRATLERWRRLSSARSPDNLAEPDAELLERLRALGYLGR